MSDRKNIKVINRLTIGIAVMLSLSIMALALVTPTTAQDTLAGSRTISDTTIAPGDTFTITVAIDITGTVYGPVLDEDVPAGWTVTEVDNAGGTLGLGTSWLWGGAQTTDKTVVYDVTVPDDVADGDYPVTGTVLATAAGETIGPFTITGDESVTISIGPSPTPSSTVSFDPASTIISPGDTFTVDVVVDSGTYNLKACRIELIYNSSVLEAINLTEGALLSSPTLTEPGSGITVGLIHYRMTRTMGNTPAAASGTFITTEFKVKEDASTGTFTLDLQNVELNDENNQPVPGVVVNDGQVVVNGPTPTPTLTPGDGNGGATTIPTTPTPEEETLTPAAEVTATPTPFVEETTPTIPPTVAPTTSTPTPTPEEPGLEAVFAIAGLLAVAYLVARRKKR